MATRGEDIIDGLIAGFTWGVPKAFGVEPPRSAAAAMDKAPIAAATGDFLSGVAIPYAAWAKATTSIPRLAKWVDRAGDLGKMSSPFARGAAREVGRFAPLELAKIGGATALDLEGSFGDINVGEVITNSAVNLALEGVGGGIIKKLGTYAEKAPKGRKLIGNSALEDPAQLQLRALDDKIKDVPAEKLPDYTAYMRKMSEAVYLEEPVNREFVNNLVDGQDRKLINNLMGNKFEGATTHKLHVTGTGPFRQPDDHLNMLGGMGVQAHMADRFMMTPRVVVFKDEAAALRAKGELNVNMTDIGDGWFKADEVDEGFKVLAKFVPETPQMPKGGLFMTVTDLPDWFRTGSANRLNKAIEENMWVRKGYRLSGGGGELGTRAIEGYRMLPFRVMQMVRQGKEPTFDTVARVGGYMPKVEKAFNSLKENQNIKGATDFVKIVAAPTRHQLKNNPRAINILGLADGIKSDGKLMAKEMLSGRMLEPKDVTKGGPIGNNLISRYHAVSEGRLHAGDGASDALDALSEKEFQDIYQWARKQELDPVMVRQAKAEGIINDKQENFLITAEGMRQRLIKETNENFKKFGNVDSIHEYSPSFISRSRHEVENLDFPDHMSKKDFKKQMEARVHDWTNKLTNNIVDNIFVGEKRLVQFEDPVVGKILNQRLNDLQDKMRPFAAKLNEVLSPMIGKDTAKTVAERINSTMYSLTLAGVNTGYLVMNPIGVVTNVVPRAMMIINGRGLSLGDDMHYWPVPGVGTVGIWDGIKAMRQSRKDIMHPDAMMLRMFDRAAVEGKMALNTVAEEVGSGSPSIKNIRQLWNDGAYASSLNHSWNFLASQSEQMSRLFAFTTSVRIARNIGLTKDDDIYRLAMKITDDSMYGYRQADKPAWMTGPVGGPLGLFKNWSMNSFADLLEYSGAAFKNGNWRPLLWQQASIMGIAGLTGSPLGYAAGKFSEMYSDDTLVQNMYEMFSEEHAGAMAFGLPMYLGFSLNPQGASPGANPARDVTSLFEPVMFDRMRAIFQAAGTGWDVYRVTGDHPAESPDVRRLLMEAVAPRTVMRIYQQFMRENAIASSRTGYPLKKDPSMSDRVWYSMGITTNEQQKRNFAADILYRDSERRNALTGGYGEALKDAIEAGDATTQMRLLRRAASDGLDLNSVARSAASRQRQGDLDALERADNPTKKAEIMKVFGLKP